MPIAGSLPLFLCGALLHLFATTSMGIFFGTIARSMPQLGLLIILVLIPLEYRDASNGEQLLVERQTKYICERKNSISC